MKKLLIVLFIISVISLNASIIEKTYHFKRPQITQIGSYQIVEFEGTQQQAKAGNPVLPYLPVSLLLPPGEAAETIEIIGYDKIQIPGTFKLYPKQQVKPISDHSSSTFLKNLNVYNSAEVYPKKLTGELTTQFLSGYSISMSSFTPVSYIPAKGKISYYKEVKIKVTTKNDERAQNALHNLHSSRYKRISKFVQNSEMLFNYPTARSREDECQLLIITPSQFEEEFEDLQEVYLKQGMLSEVKSTEEIYSSMMGQDQQEKIRNYLIQEYQDHEIEYVLLAGDIEHIPYRGFYCTVNSGSGYEDYDIPSDLYYSALDGSWNDDGDDLWGEIGEDDLLPEIAVARFSFSSIIELQNMLNKTISYQTQPVTGELRDPLMAGEHLYNDPQTWGADFLDLLIGYWNENGYETTGIPEDQNITTMYDRDMGSWSAGELISEINQGHSFIHHSGHASAEYVMRLDNSDITNSNFNMINGSDHNYTFVYTHGCICGSFDHNDCIGERMINIENFLVAFIGNSRYGWFNEGQTEGPSAHLHREFTDALYTDHFNRIGRAHMESKIATAPWVTAPGQWEEGALRWCFYDCNVLGASALPVWTDEPHDITANFDDIINIGTSEFEVEVTENGAPIEGLNCTLLQNVELVASAVTDEMGLAELQFDASSIDIGMIELYISGYNLPAQRYELEVVPNGSYVSVTEFTVIAGDDCDIEFGENVLLSMILNEVGNSGDIHNTYVELSTDDNFITINDFEENVGTISSGGSIELSDAFDFDVANDIPNEHEFELAVNITADEGQWATTLGFIGYNAVVEILNVEVIDNDNNILDPGETANLSVTIRNIGGADLYNVMPAIDSPNPDVNITNLPSLIEELNEGESISIPVCTVEIDENTQPGDEITFNFSLAADNDFYFEEEFSLTIGLSIEDFESGDFLSFDWQHAGNADWQIDDTAYEGEFSALTGDIGTNSSTSLFIELDVSQSGEISFWKKVSTETDYDYFKFFIDGNLMEEWAGEIDWSNSNYPVNPGLHTFKWEYIKDTYVSGGEDCAWLDYIVFPPIEGEVEADTDLIPNMAKLIGNYPNPFNPKTTISFSLVTETTEDTEINIYNLKGQRVRQLISGIQQLSGDQHSVIWNGKDDEEKPVGSGVYFYQLSIGDKVVDSKKCLLLK